MTVYANDQVLDADTWNNLIVAYKNGAPVRIKDVGRRRRGRREQPERRLDRAGRGHQGSER